MHLSSIAATVIIVFYDPNGGFVTGGGYITHNPASTVPPIATAGKDNFGFVAKYKKGASAPDGETEFQCKVCDINFHSTSYDWLVVSAIPGGFRAQYQGSGTINGSGNYGFLVTITDKGQIDTFRIRIWNKVGGAIVYDNEPGALDSGNPTTITAGGNIVIHDK